MSIYRRARGPLACAMTAVSFLALMAPAPALAQSFEVRQITSACYTPCVISAAANETVEVILPDATSVVLAPGSAARISRTADGGVVVDIQRGRARVAGGARNASQPIRVATPHAVLSVMDASVFIAVEDGETRTHLLNGDAVTVTTGGTTRRIYRPGYQSVANGSRVSTPRRMDVEDVVADLMSIAPSLTSGQRPRVTSAATPGGSSAPTGTVTDGTGDVDVAQAEDDDAGGDGPIGQEEPIPPVEEEPSFDLAGLGDVSVNLSDVAGSSLGDPLQVVGENSTSSTESNFYIASQNNIITINPAIDDFDDPTITAVPKSVGPSTNRLVFTVGDESEWNPESLNDGVYVPSGQVLTMDGVPSEQLVWFDSVGNGNDLSSTEPEWFFGYHTENRIQTDGINYNSGTLFGSFLFDSGSLEADVGTIQRDTLASMTFRGDSRSPGCGSCDLSNGFWEPESITTSDGFFTENFGASVTGIAAGAGFLQRREDNFFLSEITSLHALLFDQFLPDDELAALLVGRTGVFAGDIVAETYSADFDLGVFLLENLDPEYRLILASGDLDALYEAGETDFSVAPGAVDRFHVAGSMQGRLGEIENGGGVRNVTVGMDHNTGRGFLNRESWTELGGGQDLDSLTDTGVILRYPDAPVITDAGGTDAVFIHADLGFVGGKGDQVSSASVTIGALHYRLQDGEVDGLMKGRTVGSSQEFQGSTFVYHSDVHSSAAGGGNQRLGTTPGRLGFFVLENAGTLYDDIATQNVSLNGGLAFALDDTTFETLRDDTKEPPEVTKVPSDFALLRIGAGAETDTPVSDLGFGMEGRVGYAAGFLETQSGSTVSLARFQDPITGKTARQIAETDRKNLTFTGLDSAAHTFEAELTLTVAGVETKLEFGGAEKSAYVNDAEFGALHLGSTKEFGAAYGETDYAMALVSAETGAGSGDSLRSEVNMELVSNSDDKIGSYKHVQWGFFLGDANVGNARTHTHLATFASGDRIDLANVSAPSGTSLYRGHAIGTVVDDGDTRVVVGTYEDTFDFDRREGNFSLGFDNREFNGTSRMTTANTGPALYGGGAISDDFTAVVAGEFVSNGGMMLDTSFTDPTSGGVISGSAPGGLVGSFDIGNESGTYAATGTFGADNVSLIGN